jgi:23S rRNA (uracil1939-C5)-methyltransferase
MSLAHAGNPELLAASGIRAGQLLRPFGTAPEFEGELLICFEEKESAIPEMESEANVSIVSLAGDDSVVLSGEDHLVMQVNGRPLLVSAGSFFQTNFSAAEAMVNEVIAMIGERGCNRLLDIYCGVGLFSAFLAGQVKELAGIEANASACRDFAVNLDEFDNVSLYEGTAERVLPLMDFQADTVILDPPRSGLRPEAREALIKLHPETIVYVSCNPATLARDTKCLLEGGYHLQKSILVDMFPQTYHMESINLFIEK